MIVVVGSVAYRPDAAPGRGVVAGRAASIARAVAAAGADVQLVAKVGDDGAGDAVVVALGREGVGHAAVQRDAGHPTPIVAADAADAGEIEDVRDGDGDAQTVTAALMTQAPVEEGTATILPPEPDARPALEAADVELALRYLPEARVVVVAEPVTADVAEAVGAGASFSGATLVAVVEGGAVPDGLASATVFEAPTDDPDDAFARVVASYAVALDGGREPREAFAQAVAGGGWEPAATDWEPAATD